MHGPQIVIVPPALADANNGNWRTAQRWARMLGPAYRVRLAAGWAAVDAAQGDALLLALHARRSAPAIRAWRATQGAKPLIAALTGTDLYRDIDSDADAQHALTLADALIVLDARGARRLPASAHHKVQVVLQSCSARRSLAKTPQHLRLVMVGHLCKDKGARTYFELVDALAADPAQRLVLLDHIGAALDPALGDEAKALAAARPSYRWLGSLPHATVRRHIQSAHALVHPSVIEGGAHVIVEAIRSGTPVLASNIDGNLGLLGDDYRGTFPAGDAAALAALVRRVVAEPAILADFRRQCEARAPLFTPEREAASLLTLVHALLDRHERR